MGGSSRIGGGDPAPGVTRPNTASGSVAARGSHFGAPNHPRGQRNGTEFRSQSHSSPRASTGLSFLGRAVHQDGYHISYRPFRRSAVCLRLLPVPAGADSLGRVGNPFPSADPGGDSRHLPELLRRSLPRHPRPGGVEVTLASEEKAAAAGTMPVPLYRPVAA